MQPKGPTQGMTVEECLCIRHLFWKMQIRSKWLIRLQMWIYIAIPEKPHFFLQWWKRVTMCWDLLQTFNANLSQQDNDNKTVLMLTCIIALWWYDTFKIDNDLSAVPVWYSLWRSIEYDMMIVLSQGSAFAESTWPSFDGMLVKSLRFMYHLFPNLQQSIRQMIFHQHDTFEPCQKTIHLFANQIFPLGCFICEKMEDQMHKLEEWCLLKDF